MDQISNISEFPNRRKRNPEIFRDSLDDWLLFGFKIRKVSARMEPISLERLFFD